MGPVRRAVRGVALAVAFSLVLSGTVGGAAAGVGRPAAIGAIPQQEWGSAAGRSHEATSEQTSAEEKPGEVHVAPPAPGGLPADVRYPAPELGVGGPAVETVAEVGGEPAVRLDDPRGFEPGVSRELVNKRSPDTQVFANPDGTQTRRVFQGRKFFARNGLWFPIDSSLIADGATWRTRSDSLGKRFAVSADASAVASLELAPGVSVGYGVAGAKGAQGRVDGETITYPDVRSGVDLELMATPDGIKETLVLESVDAPTEWEFPLRLQGLTASLAGGSVELRDASGVVQAVIPPGFMDDSSIDPRSGEGARSWGVTYRLAGDVLHVSLDRAWLADPARVFPVRVDPSVVAQTADGSTFVQAPWTNDYSGNPNLSVGTFDGGTNKANAFLKFDSVSSALAGQYILGANLWLYNTWSYSCQARGVWVHEVTQGWSVSGNKSWPGPSFGGVLGSANFATGYEGCSPGGAWQKIELGDAGRNVVHGWTHGAANHGLTVRASESDSFGWKKFASRNSANPPYLEITYNPYWATYQVGAMTTPVTSTQDGKMQVTVTNHGRDTWTPGSNYKLSYRLWDGAGTELSGVAQTSMPHDVAPGQTATVSATIGKLKPDSYTLHFDMDHYGTTKFSWTGVPASQAVRFTVPNQAPVLEWMSPPSNYVAEVLTPTLAMAGRDPDNYPGHGLAYLFKICDAGGDGQQNCTESGWIPSSTWTVPAGKLTWGRSYVWYGAVGDWRSNSPVSHGSYLSAQVLQPAITSHLGASSTNPGGAVDPGVGNYTTSATDAVAGAIGPALSVVRNYNSLDPRKNLAFGAGWSTRWDTNLTRDADGSGNVVVTYPDGQQARFGRNADGSYAPPPGRFATLVAVSGGGWKLVTKGHVNYAFDGSGKLTAITDDFGRSQMLTYGTDGRLSVATDTVSNRSLRFTWTGGHVTKVTTSSSVSLTWTYTYDGDKLINVCDPEARCTTYDYSSVVHYRNVVLDANPTGYWRLDEATGSTAENRSPAGGPEANGTYTNVTLGAPGAMPGSGVGSGAFDGTTSYLRLPDGVLNGTKRHLSAELWFKTSSTAGGVLLGTTGHDRPNTTPVAGGMPILYVGTDGKLYGHFWNDILAGISTAAPVNDGRWHHVVLSGALDTQTLYLDGQPVGSQNSPITHSDSYVHVGAGLVSRRDWPARPADEWGHFNGAISDVAIYDRPLGATAVAEHWNATAGSQVLAKVTLPGGRVAAQVAYDNTTDRVRTHVDANGGTWTLDPLALVSKTQTAVTMTNPVGQATTQRFDPSRGGRLTSVTRPGNATQTFGYDTGGFLNKTVNANNVLETFVNDARGNPLSRSVGWNSETSGRYTSYATYYLNAADPLDPRNDRVTEHRDARSGGPTSNTFLKTYSYTLSGDIAGTTLPGSDATSRRSTSTTYTTGTEPAVEGGTMPAGLVLTETNTGGGVTTYAYTSRGNLREITDPAGKKTIRLYDGLGRLVSEKVVSATVPNGATTTYTYDGLSRVLTRTEPAVTNAVTGVAHRKRTTNTYNPDGTPASVQVDDAALNDPGRTTGYTYDAFGRVATTTDPVGAVTRTEYDVMGQPTRLVDATGTEFTYTYTRTLHQLATKTVKGFTGDGGAPRDVVLESRAYDPVGQLASLTDAMGRTTGYEYRFTGTLYADTLLDYRDPTTGAVRDVNLHYYYFDGAGNFTGLETWGGIQFTKYIRDPAGRVVRTDDHDNDCYPCYHTGYARSKFFTYDRNDNLTSETAKNADGTRVAQTDYTYDALGRELTRSVHTGSSTLVTTTTRDEQGLPLTVTDPRGAGHTTTFGYDAAGRQTSSTGPSIQAEANGAAPVTTTPTEKVGYNTYGEVVDRLDVLGHKSRIDYDAAGMPTSTTLPAYTSPAAAQPITATSTTGYDALGRVVSTTDAAGSTTNFAYDQLGNQVRRTDPLLPGQTQRGVWTATFDPVGERLSTTDPTGAQTMATYDMLGTQITSTVVERTPAPTRNLTTRFDYDRVNRLSEVVTPNGHKTKYLFDDLGNQVWTSDPLGNVSTAAYDALGRRVSATDALGGKTTATYDLAGRMTATADLGPAGTTLRTRTFGYDAAGNQTSTTDGLGKTTSRTYDAGSRLTSVTRPGPITSSYGYDSAGNITRSTDGNGNATVFTVNSWGLPETTVEPATAHTPAAADRTYTSSYDAMGRIATLTKPGGVSVTNSYDPAGNLVKQTGAGASVPTPDRTFGYDLIGRMTSASAPGGANTYTYDDRGNIVNATGPSGASSFTFDNQNRLAGVSTSAGTTTYGYDAAGRLASAVDPITGTAATYTRDALGRATAVGHGTATATRTHTYDPLGRPAADTITTPGGAVTASTTYTFDTEDRLTGKTTTGLAGAGTNTYGYDDAGRLTSWNNGTGTTEYGWDPAGNLTRDGPISATYDQRNHLLTRGGTTNTYTARGTLASRTTDGTTTNLAFNAYDELVTDGATTNTYDALGRLVNTGSNALAYRATSQTIIAAGSDVYTHTPDGTPLGVKQGTTTATAVTDLHTDLVATLNPTTGAITGSRTYGPFGAVQAAAGTQPGLGYQHQWTDPATGNVNMGSRWYQPGTGTFASRDTAALNPTDLTTANRHAYTAANPLTSIDPTGHTPVCLAPAIAGPPGAAASAACFAGSFLFLALAGGAMSAGFGVPLPGNSNNPVPGGTNNPAPTPKPGGGNTPTWIPSTTRYPDGEKPNPGRWSTPPVQPSTPTQSRGTGNTRRSTYYGGTTVTKAVQVRDYRAERVLANALTAATRQALTPSISAGVQAAINAANGLPTIDLGTILAEGSTSEQSFQPERAADASGSGIVPAQGRLEGACQTGGYLHADVFGGVARSTQMWQCGENPTWVRTNFNGQRVYQRDDLVNPDYVSPNDKYGRSNMKRMQQGLAPIGPDDKPLNLHHMLQTQDGPVAELTYSMHFGYYGQLHWKSGTNIPSGIDRDIFNLWKAQYWKYRATGF